MKGFIKLVFYVGFLFWGGGFLIEFSQFCLYNGVSDFFVYVKADDAIINYEKTFSKEMEITNIYYSYIVNNKLYESKETSATSVLIERGVRINEIYYNKNFPSFSYVGDNNHSLRKAKVGMVIFGFFFLFIFLIYKFADMDKWIGIYTRGEYKSSKK